MKTASKKRSMGRSAAPVGKVRPRDAASVVITRGGGAGTRVLLGRRPPRDRFMPDVWVFPGGRVDTADRSASVRRELPRSVSGSLRKSAPPDRIRALAVAALREAWEETGLVFGERQRGALVPDLSNLGYLARAITPTLNPIRYHARFFHASAEAAGGRLRSNGELLDLAWFSIDEALALPIIDVTEAVLEHLRSRIAGRRRDALFVHYRGMRRLLDYE